jgi:phosphoenolpyruvate carboxykinase (ATP)
MLLANATRTVLLQQTRQTSLKAATARSLSSLTSAAACGGPSSTSKQSNLQRPACVWTPQKFYQSTASKTQPDTSGRDAYNVSQTLQGKDACRKGGVDTLGITGPTTVYRNLTFQQLFDHEVANKEGVVAKAEHGDTFTVDTGKFTGRSPNDRWIVKNPGSETDKHMDWNAINQPTTPEVFDELYDKAVAYFNTRETVYVFDGYCGASPATRKKIRFVHEMAWQQHFGTWNQRNSTVVWFIIFLSNERTN